MVFRYSVLGYTLLGLIFILTTEPCHTAKASLSSLILHNLLNVYADPVEQMSHSSRVALSP